MLRVENLDVFYGDAQALDGVSLEIEQGEHRRHRRRQRRRQDLAHPRHRRHAAAPAGRIVYRGSDISGWPSYRVCDLGIGQVAEGRQVFPTLTVAENLDVGAMLPRARAGRVEEPRARAVAVSAARRAAAPGRRHAVRRRAADAGDRPLPDGRARAHHVRRAVARACARPSSTSVRHHPRAQRDGITCLLVEQNVAQSLKLANRAYVLENGRMTLSGSGAELLADDRVRSAYLGL